MALIYIVEDDPSIQEIEVMALKNSNYMVQAFDRKKSFRISFCSTSCFLMRMVIKSCAD